MSKPTKLFIGLPCYDGWNPKFAVSLISAMNNAPCPLMIQTIDGDSLIPRARNNLAAMFLASDCSHLLFLDVDLEFNPATLHRLVNHNLDIVGGYYEQKRYDIRIPVFNKMAGEEIDEDGLAKVRHVGTGMLRIARRVFEKLIEDGAKKFRRCDDERDRGDLHEFFPIGPHEGIYESEDWAFCRMARESGFDVWVDTQSQAIHHGHGFYPNDAVEKMRND